MAKVHDILIDCTDAALTQMNQAEGTMPSGHNGPWNDAETPVRNTSHWTILFLFAHDQTGDTRYLDAAKQCINYLTSEAARPYGKTFHHLNNPKKYYCNGLVGQAWSIEALATAARYLDQPRLIELAAEVFLLHPFDEQVRCWRSIEIDGKPLTFDMTFNHQLWFAAAGGILSNHNRTPDEVNRQVKSFLDELDLTINVSDTGLIKHPVKPEFDLLKYGKIVFDNIYRGSATKFFAGVLQSTTGDSMINKEIGYHSFNLYGLAILAEHYPDHSFWDSSKFKRAVAYGQSTTFRKRLNKNSYGYPYNVSGIEMAYVEHIFGNGDENIMADWVSEQFDRTFDPKSKTHKQNCSDPVTVTARLYEMTRLPNFSFGYDKNNE